MSRAEECRRESQIKCQMVGERERGCADEVISLARVKVRLILMLPTFVSQFESKGAKRKHI